MNYFIALSCHTFPLMRPEPTGDPGGDLYISGDHSHTLGQIFILRLFIYVCSICMVGIGLCAICHMYKRVSIVRRPPQSSYHTKIAPSNLHARTNLPRPVGTPKSHTRDDHHCSGNSNRIVEQIYGAGPPIIAAIHTYISTSPQICALNRRNLRGDAISRPMEPAPPCVFWHPFGYPIGPTVVW